MEIFSWFKEKKINLLLGFVKLTQTQKRPNSINSSGSERGLIGIAILIGIAVIGGLVLAHGTTIGKVLEVSLANLVIAFVVILLQIPLFLANIFFSVNVAILALVTSENFINLSYTNPAGNEILQLGWGLTRDLANVGIVISLLVIGIATILRIEEYKWQKTLPRLIVIALLINFTPVILGLIVDASNILIRTFLGEYVKWETISNMFAQHGDTIKQTLSGFTEEVKAGPLGKTFVLILFALISGLIILIYALLFLARYVAIWVLVIISPIAFVCRILPSARLREFWNLWWSQFIQWCLVGVYASFFLWLTGHMLKLVEKNELTGAYLQTPSGATEGSREVAGMLNDMFPYMVPMAFLIFGLMLMIRTQAMGASAILGGTRAAGKWVGGRVWRGGLKPTVEPLLKTAVARGIRGVEKVRGLRWFIPEAVRKYSEFRPTIEKEQARIKTYASHILGPRMAKGIYSGTEGAASLLELAQRGDLEDLFSAGRKEFGVKSNDELLRHPVFQKRVGKLLDIVYKGGYLNPVIRRDPRLGTIAAARGVKGYKGLSPEKGVQKALSEAREQHITDWELQVVQEPQVVEAMMAHFDRDRWLAVGRKVKRGQEESLKVIDKLFSEYVRKNNLQIATEEQQKAAWENYEKAFKKEHGGFGGYFEGLKDPSGRMTGAAWRPGQYRERGEEEAAPTPGAVAGVTPPAPRGRRAGGVRPTIEERLRPPGKVRPPAGMAYSPSGEVKLETEARKEWENFEKKPKGRRAGGGPSKPPKGRGV
jgi:hypothetical protein